MLNVEFITVMPYVILPNAIMTGVILPNAVIPSVEAVLSLVAFSHFDKSAGKSRVCIHSKD